MEKLTAKQQKIYDYIQTFSAEHGYPPSVREIGAAVGLKSPSTVHFHLKGAWRRLASSSRQRARPGPSPCPAPAGR